MAQSSAITGDPTIIYCNSSPC